MESVITVVRGDRLTSSKCKFCNKEALYQLLLTKKATSDGIRVYWFGICEEHKDKINTIISGQYDIDLLFSDKPEKERRRSINLRSMPKFKSPSLFQHVKARKQCKFVGCTNTFVGVANQDYCRDPRCIELRNEFNRAKERKKLRDNDAINLVLSSRYKKRLHKGQVLKLRCRAKSSIGTRCNNYLYITFDPKQSVYPMFCECHRSAYKRSRFYLQKG
jgi:hypothetical protein